MQNKDLTGKVALITGGARRIGATIGQAFHAEGMRLVVHYRGSSKDAHALQTRLNEQREDSVVLVRGDLLDVAKLANLVHETVQAFGRLDVLVNNASRFYSTRVGSVTEDHWEELVGTNLKAPFFLSQAAAPALKKHRGCVINVCDIYSERPLASHAVYCATKAGLVSLTRSLARDLAPEIRVNGISPGAIMWPEQDSDQVSQQRIISRTPLKSIGDPTDIAQTALYLLRDAPFVSGQVIAVDGGRSIVP